MGDITDIGGEPTNDEIADTLDLVAADLGELADGKVSWAIGYAAKRLRASRSPAAGAEGEDSGFITCASHSEHSSPERSAPSAAWRPIETAPKDGSLILACGNQLFDACSAAEVFVGTVEWQYGRWQDGTIAATPTLTHWMPLPEPPAVDDGAGKGVRHEL